jgi:putative endonuclease
LETSVSIGRQGENQAATYLVANGFDIKETNFKHGRNEIDIIVRKHNLLVFVEVKYRKNNVYGYPESFLSKAQEDRILDAAEAYIFEIDWNGDIRFDIISIEAKGKLSHLEDAFH